MTGLLLGIILVVSLAFLAFLLTITVVSVANRKPGQSFAEAGSATIASGWNGLKSTFVDTPSEVRRREGRNAPEMKPFQEMRMRSPEGKYYSVPAVNPYKTSGISSFQRAAQPIVFSGAASVPLPVHDINAPGADAYNAFAAEALAEDLDVMAGQHRFGERPLPAPPITDDMFRYTGNFEIKQGDPYLATPLTKKDIGFSNRGVGLFTPGSM